MVRMDAVWAAGVWRQSPQGFDQGAERLRVI